MTNVMGCRGIVKLNRNRNIKSDCTADIYSVDSSVGPFPERKRFLSDKEPSLETLDLAVPYRQYTMII